MNAVVQNIPPSASKRFNEVSVRGRIEVSRSHQKKHYTRVICPAPDAYSRPQIVEIRSNARLGQREEEITVDCKLGGYTRKPYPSTDKESGEITQITPVDMTLDAIE